MNDKINTFIFGRGEKYDTHKENLKEEVIQEQIEENIQSDDKEKEKENKLYQILTNINENLKIITLKFGLALSLNFTSVIGLATSYYILRFFR